MCRGEVSSHLTFSHISPAWQEAVLNETQLAIRYRDCPRGLQNKRNREREEKMKLLNRSCDKFAICHVIKSPL